MLSWKSYINELRGDEIGGVDERSARIVTGRRASSHGTDFGPITPVATSTDSSAPGTRPSSLD